MSGSVRVIFGEGVVVGIGERDGFVLSKVVIAVEVTGMGMGMILRRGWLGGDEKRGGRIMRGRASHCLLDRSDRG